jgi:hypothetical protein
MRRSYQQAPCRGKTMVDRHFRPLIAENPARRH